MALKSTIMTAAAKKATGTGTRPSAVVAHGGEQDQNRDDAAPGVAQQQRPFGQRQKTELAQEFAERRLVALQDDDVAQPQRYRSRAFGPAARPCG